MQSNELKRGKTIEEIIKPIICNTAMTAKELSVLTNKKLDSVSQSLYRMHNRQCVHVEEWIKHNGQPSARYKLGVGKDAPKPVLPSSGKKKQPREEYTMERLIHSEAKAKAIEARRKFERFGVAGIDPLTAIFYG